jgi:hypothetical protein
VLALSPGRAVFEPAAALAFGVDFGAVQDRDVGDPEPDEEDDDPAERALGLVAGPSGRRPERFWSFSA